MQPRGWIPICWLQASDKSHSPADAGAPDSAPCPEEPGDIEDLAMPPTAAMAAAVQFSNTPPAALAAHSASVSTAAPLPQAVATDQKYCQQPAEHAEPAELKLRPAESAAVIGSQSDARLGHNAEHAEVEQTQSTGLQLPPGIHACAAASASCAECSSSREDNKVPSVELKEGACCLESSSVEDVIGTLLEAGRTMDGIERLDSAAEEPARWEPGSKLALMVPLLCSKGVLVGRGIVGGRGGRGGQRQVCPLGCVLSRHILPPAEQTC